MFFDTRRMIASASEWLQANDCQRIISKDCWRTNTREWFLENDSQRLPENECQRMIPGEWLPANDCQRMIADSCLLVHLLDDVSPAAFRVVLDIRTFELADIGRHWEDIEKDLRIFRRVDRLADIWTDGQYLDGLLDIWNDGQYQESRF